MKPAQAPWQHAYAAAVNESDALPLWKHIEVAESSMRLRLDALAAGAAEYAAVLHGLTVLDHLKRHRLGFHHRPHPDATHHE